MQSMSARAAAAGAFLGIAHPQWYGLTTEDALSPPFAHAVEIYNHGCAIDCDRGDGLVVLEEVLAAGKRLNAYAADDAHFHTPDAGGSWVIVKAEALEPELLLSALKQAISIRVRGRRFMTSRSLATKSALPVLLPYP
jgi:hypothetical protein